MSISLRNIRRARTFRPSRLNIRTNRLYERCQVRGGCQPSETFVVRPFALGDFELPVCRRCGVPIRKRSRVLQTTWMNQREVA